MANLILDQDLDGCCCDWAAQCNGLAVQHCAGCGGDACICRCGGERECPGCAFCDTRPTIDLTITAKFDLDVDVAGDVQEEP